MDTCETFNCNIGDFFEKKFFFEKNSDWILPCDIQKQDTRWNIDGLNGLKKALNETKSLLNDKGQDWHEHTANINKAALVFDFIKEKIQPEILTQAWCKFYEIVSSFSIIPVNKLHVRSLHLCEAPGAFISALNYYLCVNHLSTNWEWMANTLNPYYEGHSIKSVVVDDRLLFPTLKHWYFGKDNTGDITDASYIDDLCNTVKRIGLFDLVTADGSVDCLENPGEQELIVEKLHFSEVLIALNCLAPQGCFIVKKFTFFECSTICQLYLLNCVFEKVHVFKPFTSRPSNSEVYVICIGFWGSDTLTNILQQFKNLYCTENTVAIFPMSAIPNSFIQQIEACMKYFTDLQIKAIKENLMLYPLKDDIIIEKLNNLKVVCAQTYIQKYEVYSNLYYDSLKLCSNRKVLTSFTNESYHTNMKTMYFQAVGDTFNNIVKSPSMQWYDKLIDVEKRINTCFPTHRKRPFEKIEWQSPWKVVTKRMKSKNFENWIVFGRKVTSIQNSKFCYPFLLYLWNRISLDTKVNIQSHLKFECYWYPDSLENMLKEEDIMTKNIVVLSVSQKCSENDSLLSHLKKNFDINVTLELSLEADFIINVSPENKIVYINTMTWEKSLHNECVMKEILTKALLHALKAFKKGDTLLLCIQSLLTRYMVGLIFLFVSLFDKFTTVLPLDSAPAYMGQLWIFKNYQSNIWANNVLQYLKTINELNSLEEKAVLEIVPMTSLCGGPFYAYIRNLNNKHLLQRLRSLVSVEKTSVEESV